MPDQTKVNKQKDKRREKRKQRQDQKSATDKKKARKEKRTAQRRAVEERKAPATIGDASVTLNADSSSEALRDKIKSARKEFRDFKEIYKEQLQRIRDEYDNPPSLESVKAQNVRALAELTAISGELTRVKANINQIKREISEWKAWNEQTQHEDELAARDKLNAEIAQRSELIAQGESRIQELLVAELDAEGVVEATAQMLIAIEAGLYKGKYEDDPRVLSLELEFNRLKGVLQGLRQEAK